MDLSTAADQFVNQYNGKHIDEDGYYGAQCWDVVARYAREKFGVPSMPTGSGGAEGLYRIFANPLPQYFDRVANNKNDPNQLPPKGSILVWDGSFSPPWGHTAIVLDANKNGVTVFEQNGNNPGGNAYIKTRPWTGVSGWLVPKNKGGSAMAGIPDQDNWFNRFNDLMYKVRGRNITREEFRKNFVGVDPFRMVEIVSDSPEADQATKDQELGQLARRDNWQGQIYGLLDVKKNLESALAQANADLTAARQQLQDLGSRPTKAQLDEAIANLQKAEEKAKDAQAKYEEANQKYQEAQTKLDTDKEAGDSFLRRVGQFISKYLPGGK